jgi:hypothetical protein
MNGLLVVVVGANILLWGRGGGTRGGHKLSALEFRVWLCQSEDPYTRYASQHSRAENLRYTVPRV